MKIESNKKYEVYMEMARSIAKLSPDKETQVGAVMLSDEGRIIATSFNGYLRGADDDALPTTRPEKYIFMQHAERNILYNCCYEGIKTKNSTILCTLSPCEDCVRASYQSGVKTIVFDKLYRKFKDVGFYSNFKDLSIKTQKRGEFTVLDLRPWKEKSI